MISIEYLRSFRLGPYAIFDFAASFLGVMLIAPVLSRIFLRFNLKIPLISWIFFTIPVSILIHLAVGNITPMTRNFLDPSGFYLLKIVITLLIYFGIKNIKIDKK